MRVALEEQIEKLLRCSIALRPGIGLEELLAEYSREDFETEPYGLLLCAMGQDSGERDGFLSDNIWHFDSECIEGPGSYTAIAKRMQELAGGALPLEAIVDDVDDEAETAWLSFRLDGQAQQWDACFEGDWVDATILTRFAALLEARRTEKRFTYCDLGGQDCLIGCSTAAQLQQLRETTGLDFEWLAEMVTD